MKNLREYGTAVMTLSDLVDDFCLAQNNMRETAILAQYRHARWSWKELFRTTLWNIRKAVLCVDCENHTIILPDDCESNKIIAISVVDCYGKLHPLGFNSDWNTAKIKCTKVKCSCNSCGGEDSLCAAIDSISAVMETVVIRGTPYTKTTLTRCDAAGAVQTQETIPTWDESTGTVKDIVIIKTICNVEVTDKGCIKVTQPNMDLLRMYCGCGNFIDNWNSWGFGWGNNGLYRELIPAVYNYWGEWNYNAANPKIIHIFGTGRQQHFGNNDVQENEWRGSIRQVIVDYQTNGETPDTEILVPEYAVEAIEDGMFYRQKKLNPRASMGDREEARMAWERGKTSVAKYLNPMYMETIAKLQTNKRLW